MPGNDTLKYVIAPSREHRPRSEQQFEAIKEELRLTGQEVGSGVAILVSLSSNDMTTYRQKFDALIIEREIMHHTLA